MSTKIDPKAELRHYSEKRARCGTCGEWYFPVDFEQHEHRVEVVIVSLEDFERIRGIQTKAYVHVWARGHYSGSYPFASVELAEADAAERRSSMGQLGLFYLVTDSDEKPTVWDDAAVESSSGRKG